MRKTKIVCTLGPATDRDGILREMLLAGMNVARFNFSHGSHEEHKGRLDALKVLREELQLPVAAMLDTRGPEIRLKTFAAGSIQLRTGQEFTLTTENIVGDQDRCAITYSDLPQDVRAGDTILLDDGLVRLTVLETLPTAIRCRVENDGVMKDRKGVNVPNVRLSMPYMSQRDREDILFGVQQGFDYIAASFVRTAADVREIRRLLDQQNSSIQIIAKIENQEGVSNVADILAAADGIMVARGDMGVEIDFTEIPIIQKEIIAQCVACGKPVITATQMLDSMMEHPRPTRAEITDVANAIYDGTSAIMLSGETAAGKYPVEAIQTMDAIAQRTESDINYAKRMRNMANQGRLSIAAATAHAACTTAMDIGADAILTVSKSGTTARLVSRFRPGTTVAALLMDPQVQRQMALYWGVVPLTMPRASSTDELVEFAVQAAEEAALVKQGDLVVVTAGVPVGVSGTTNMIRVRQVGGSLLNAIGIGDKKAVGPLCVCHTLEEVADKFRPGSVLVVPYTTNDLLPYVRQAAAVISEEASGDGHTATIGLTLDIPVIVGASGATRHLQDGMMVSVDCARGMVSSLPQ
ncbi:pyruvate kinase [Dysosmobacter sp. NSJ-60]|uniref:Pyruvate kinase n=1 Tax=Pusillibacter faecalis TaxID=2714358 RepID=A0A810Q9C4_9FIRM|nr:pyruvate kinase [Pusillibacter faecalis]MBC5747173.1 pyruvate kinase [Dysosmobacter hominis]MBS5658149.1 pyruvate kinase [Oscillibacter sp.]MCQ5027087.1 pyruvate kinase [Oscillibacter valericigenes]BCK84574.1 pyruvate kinase [Pusillibacter faecalis]